MKSTDPPIVVEQIFATSIAKLWTAVTDLSEMKQWYFENIPAFEAVVGFETEFPVQSEDRVFTHRWKVTEVHPMKRITYQWKYVEYPGSAYVTFELLSVADQLSLKLTNRIVEDFPSDIPEFKTESCKAGWDYFISDRLLKYINGI